MNFRAIEGLDGIKQADVEIAGKTIRIAVAHGTGNVEKVLERIRAAREAGEEPPYHFVEVMACRGGCIAGGGQPRVMLPGQPKPRGITDDIRRKRAKGLFDEDLKAANRLSHHNQSIKILYEEYGPTAKKPISCCTRTIARARLTSDKRSNNPRFNRGLFEKYQKLNDRRRIIISLAFRNIFPYNTGSKKLSIYYFCGKNKQCAQASAQ